MKPDRFPAIFNSPFPANVIKKLKLIAIFHVTPGLPTLLSRLSDPVTSHSGSCYTTAVNAIVAGNLIFPHGSALQVNHHHLSHRRWIMPVILREAPREVGVGVRTALLRDLPRVLQIERLAFGGQWDYYHFKASLDDVFLVAVDAATGDIVGFLVACCCKVARRGIILRVAVHPDFQGRGIATQLLEESFQKLKKKGLDEVELDVDIVKGGAKRLYEKLGFRLVSTLSPDFDEDETFYIMRKKLDR
jgi:ribosomal-protein-alanine N-acetyltransferase